jgi:predicted Mrr-cat superfamily restriction endonuclease
MPSNKQAFLFRVAPNKVNKIDDALRRNRIYIGWKAVQLLDSSLTKSEFKDAVSEAYPEYTPKQLGKATARLWEFFRLMRKGDLLVVPPKDKGRRHFYLAIVDGPPKPYTGSDPDIAFERRVAWLNDKQPYLRSTLSGRLNHVLKNRPTSKVIGQSVLVAELEAIAGGLWFPDELDESQFYPQAAMQRVLVNKYERDRKRGQSASPFTCCDASSAGSIFKHSTGKRERD